MYEDKRVNERPSSYHRQDERHSASRSYSSQTSGRQNEISSGPRYQSRGRASSQSGSYRGRVSRGSSRGFQRLGPRPDALSSRKRTLNTLDYRRKLIGTRPRDYVQRARITTKIRRSSGTSRLSGSKKETSTTSMKDKMAKAINAEFSDDDDEEDNKSNWDDDEKPLDHDEDEDEPTEEKKPKEEKRKKEIEEIEKEQSDDEEVKDEEMERNEDEEEEEVELKDEIIDEDRDKEDEKSLDANRSGSEELPSRRDGKRYIKLNCPHCVHRSVTFKEYSLHLYSGRHNAAMRHVAARRKAELARMRVVQRQEQKRIEAKDESRGTLPSRTLFCPICKLNYRSLKAMHQLSESHRQIKRFLAPFCRICRIPFRSPMLYETHICSLDHIKRKSLIYEEKRTEMKKNGRNDESSGAEEDDKEVNLENFMTLDSVGDVDEEEEIAEKKKKEGTEAEGVVTETTADKKAKTKQMIKVGAEFIKRIEVNFCDLCKAYLPINENADRAIAFHCSTRSHLRRYVRNNDDKALRRQAERIHLQSSSVTANAASANASATENTPSNGDQVSSDKNISTSDGVTVNDDGKPVESQKKALDSSAEKELVDEEEDDDLGEDNVEQLWDKDMNDMMKLGEVGGKSSDDEDSRYDRFRISEKKLKEKEGKKEDDKENGTSKLDTKSKTDKLEK